MICWTVSYQCITDIWYITLLHNRVHIAQWWIICCGGGCHWSCIACLTIPSMYLFFCLFSHFGLYFFPHLEIYKCFASNPCISKIAGPLVWAASQPRLLFHDPIESNVKNLVTEPRCWACCSILQRTQPLRDTLTVLTAGCAQDSDLPSKKADRPCEFLFISAIK